MDFFEKNNFTGNGVITLERLAQVDNNFSLLFRDNHNRIVGCGFYNNNLSEDEYSGSSCMVNFYDKLKDENYCKMNTMTKFLFIVTDNHFYYCDLNVKYPIAPKTESIAKFIEFANELVGLGIKQEEQNKRREEEK